MASAPHLCAIPGCAAVLTHGRHCPGHAVERERARPNRDQRRAYYTKRWKATRAQILREQAYRCADCGHVQAALEVDHITRPQGDARVFWDRANLQLLCRSCHQRKTQRGE